MVLRKRVITGLIVTALGAVAVAGAIGIPSAYSIQGLQSEINDAQAAIDERVAMFRYLRLAAADLETTKQRVATLSKVAIHEGQELEFITTMEGAAAAAGVEQDISLDTVSQKEISAWERLVPVRLSVTGSYAQFRDYLERLERLPYLVSVRSFTVARTNADEESSSNVSVQLSATAYWIGAGGPAFTRVTNP